MFTCAIRNIHCYCLELNNRIIRHVCWPRGSISYCRHKFQTKTGTMSLDNFQLLTELPTSLSCAVLSDWLPIKSLCRLDSAMCERSKRAALLSLLQSIEFINKLGCWKKDQLVWLNRRSIRTSELLLTAATLGDVVEEYLQRFGHHVRSVHLSEDSGEHLLHLVAHHCRNILRYHSTFPFDTTCERYVVLKTNPNLNELTIGCFGPEPTQPTPPTQPAGASLAGVALPKLKYLSLGGFCYDDDSCVALVQLTSQLCYLSFNFTLVTSFGFLAAAQCCPHLRFLRPPSMFDIDQALLKVTQICIYIQHVDLSRCAILSDAGIIAIAKNVRGLRTIHFVYSTRITNVCLHHLAAHQNHSLEVFSVIDFDSAVAAPAEDPQLFSIEAVAVFRSKCTILRTFCWQMQVTWFHESATALLNRITAAIVTALSLSFVDDAVLSAVAERFTQLEILNMVQCSTTIGQCSDAMLVKVAESCVNLHSVEVNRSQIARMQQVYTAFPHINVYNSYSSTDACSLQLLYRREHPVD